MFDLSWGAVLDDTPWRLCGECVEEILLNTGPERVAERATRNIHNPANGPKSAQGLRLQIVRLFAALRAAYERGAQFR